MNRRELLAMFGCVPFITIGNKSIEPAKSIEAYPKTTPAKIQGLLDYPDLIVQTVRSNILKHISPFQHSYLSDNNRHYTWLDAGHFDWCSYIYKKDNNHIRLYNNKDEINYCIPLISLKQNIQWNHNYTRTNRWDIFTQNLNTISDKIKKEIQQYQTDMLKYCKSSIIFARMLIPISHDLKCKYSNRDDKDQLTFTMKYGLIIYDK